MFFERIIRKAVVRNWSYFLVKELINNQFYLGSSPSWPTTLTVKIKGPVAN